MKRLAVLGASGHGKVVAEIALDLGWTSITFFDDAWPKISNNGCWTVDGDCEHLIKRIHEFDGVVVAIGNCHVRLKKQNQMNAVQGKIATLVHPGAYVSRFVSIGSGSVVMPGVVINTDVCVGAACIINSGATLDHDCVLADGVHIAPGANVSGSVSVGECSWVGVGAAIKQGICIGTDVMVGAGAVVIRDVVDGVTVVGNPAKPMGSQIC